jgi:hypothetical protein
MAYRIDVTCADFSSGLSIILMRSSGTNLMDPVLGFLHVDATAQPMIHRLSLAFQPSIQTKQETTP